MGIRAVGPIQPVQPVAHVVAQEVYRLGAVLRDTANLSRCHVQLVAAVKRGAWAVRPPLRIRHRALERLTYEAVPDDDALHASTMRSTIAPKSCVGDQPGRFEMPQR